MDTFFATKKYGKSVQGRTFVTNKGFVCLVPMKSKGEVLQAIKKHSKEIGSPESTVFVA